MNCVAMRDAMSLYRNDGSILHPENHDKLVRANFLFHAAHNSFLVFELVCIVTLW